ncbi:outer membrane lipoprotein LolB [Pseudoduganella namucuonensis]|uniref:Outer-membrane lipoprotein LolB n=1 Tax=Pseudoduganella namucuonensis TaxID=1035707 RepID=A0A1I7KE33_9BURK|nr:outer membrane lipoprotein LolB [Pseudoduganella namucuonensis]SFU95655.1 outer membrane lipoprotein LolB [Pseudoduganella namucuonensis]
MTRKLPGAPALLAVLLAALISGCATTPAIPPSAAPVAPYSDTLDLAGKLAVTYSKDGKSESMYGRFAWQQSAARTDVTITAPPLNQTVATISVAPGRATLTESGKPPRTAADIDTLSAQALGWTLPVSGLREWLQGYATAAGGKRYTASPAANTVTTADGWRLTYVSWQDSPGAPRPKRIDVERGATGQLDEMTIRIVIDSPAT